MIMMRVIIMSVYWLALYFWRMEWCQMWGINLYVHVFFLAGEQERSAAYGLVSATFAASLVTSPALGAYVEMAYGQETVVALATAIAVSSLMTVGNVGIHLFAFWVSFYVYVFFAFPCSSWIFCLWSWRCQNLCRKSWGCQLGLPWRGNKQIRSQHWGK